MTSAQPSQPADRRRRRLIVIAIVVLVVAAVVIAGLVAGWFLFFGSEAPPAPTIDEAIKVLLPSAPPE